MVVNDDDGAYLWIMDHDGWGWEDADDNGLCWWLMMVMMGHDDNDDGW